MLTKVIYCVPVLCLNQVKQDFPCISMFPMAPWMRSSPICPAEPRRTAASWRALRENAACCGGSWNAGCWAVRLSTDLSTEFRHPRMLNAEHAFHAVCFFFFCALTRQLLSKVAPYPWIVRLVFKSYFYNIVHKWVWFVIEMYFGNDIRVLNATFNNNKMYLTRKCSHWAWLTAQFLPVCVCVTLAWCFNCSERLSQIGGALVLFPRVLEAQFLLCFSRGTPAGLHKLYGRIKPCQSAFVG